MENISWSLESVLIFVEELIVVVLQGSILSNSQSTKGIKILGSGPVDQWTNTQIFLHLPKAEISKNFYLVDQSRNFYIFSEQKLRHTFWKVFYLPQKLATLQKNLKIYQSFFEIFYITCGHILAFFFFR